MYPTVDLSGKVDVVVDGRKTSVSDPREDDALKRVLTAIGKLKQTKAPNKASDATSEPAPGAASSSHQR
jgi:beta-glucosidase-like glycosyl hydrolase